MRALDDIVRQGKARYVGVSNFRRAQLDACMQLRRIDVVQYGWNMFDRRMQREIFPWCAAQGVGVMAYGSLAYGMLTGAFHADMLFDETDWRSKRGMLGATQPVPHHVRAGPFPAQPARGGGTQGAGGQVRQDTAAIRAALDAEPQRDPHRARRLPPRGRGGRKSRCARLRDLAGGHGSDRRHLRPQRRRHRTARLAGGRTCRLRPRQASDGGNTMPVQRFAAMTKDFATFDCDAHVTEPPLIWERAAEYLTREEMQALRSTIWWDEESRQLIVNGRAGVGIGSPRRGGIPGTMRVISNAGPGVKHDIQRALNVRNLKAATALTQDQVGYIDFAGSYEPEPRLRDMDVQGIDQVMIIPTDIDTYPWLLDAVGAKAFCKAYNQWAYEYTKADPDRLFFAALLPMQNAQFAVQEVHRVAAQGCRVALVRPTDAMGNYPLQPKYEPVWNALEETGMVYGMHPFPAGGALKPAGLFGAVFRRRADPAHYLRLRHPALLPDQRAELSVGGVTVGDHRADDGIVRAPSEAEGRGVRGIVHLAQLPARRVRQGIQAVSQRTQTAAVEASAE